VFRRFAMADDGDNNGNENVIRKVPPPEAFQIKDELQFPRHTQQSGVEPESMSNTNTNTMAVHTQQRRPSLLVRRQSSLFSQLPVRNKSRLFDFGGENNNNNNNNIAAETAMTNFSQPTWLQEDHQSTLLGDGSSSQLFPSDDGSESHSSAVQVRRRQSQSQSQQQKQHGKSSLFGAVMRKFGSSIPSSPFGKGSNHNRDDNVDDTSAAAAAGGGGGISSLLTSPSGKSIMNIVNRFNSPFKFQSPQGSKSNNKKRHRRRLWGDLDEEQQKDAEKSTIMNKKDDSAFSTPSPSSKKRRRFEQMADDEDEGSNVQRSNILFPDRDDSRSSLFGNEAGGDHHWREAPIVDVGDNDSTMGMTTIEARMEILDWSLPTKVRIEVHGVRDTFWARDMLRDNDKALTYWEYRSNVNCNDTDSTTVSTGIQKSSGLLRRSISTNGLQQKNIGKKTMSRQDSFQGIGGNGEVITAGSSDDKNTNSTDTADLAKYLIQSVRGPRAKYSRKRAMEDDWEQNMITTPDDNKERSQRQWQQSMRSIFSNYRRRLDLLERQGDTPCPTLNCSTNAIILDSYFYCLGQDHSVLFRFVLSSDGGDGNNKIDHAIPAVLVSSTSDSFRKQLEQHGMDMNDGSFQLLESIEEREARERARIIAAAAAAKKSRMMKALLSPGVKADLEALRRAQAFGEQAGADVMVKVKKSIQQEEDELNKDKLPKAVRISGWDNVSLFFEVYLNKYGDVMGSNINNNNNNNNNIVNGRIDGNGTSRSNRTLPLLICGNGIGPFEHASMKRLRLFPVAKETESDINGSTVAASEQNLQQETTSSDSIDICGILLPCAIRKLLLVARNRILEEQKSLISVSDKSCSVQDEKKESGSPQDSSRYVVLHSMRPNKPLSKSLMVGLNGSLVFNQGKKKKKKKKNLTRDAIDDNGSVFECPNGKVVSMAVWDTSREEVAACKLDDAFPDNWFKK
jgi:hypothetical protein